MAKGQFSISPHVVRQLGAELVTSCSVIIFAVAIFSVPSQKIYQQSTKIDYDNYIIKGK